MTHSPEPWSWTEDRPGCKDKNALVDGDGKKILRPVSGWDRTDLGLKIEPADMGLITAAPKLLAQHKNDIDMLQAIDVMCVDSKDYEIITGEIQAMIRRKLVLIQGIESQAQSDKALTHPS